MKWQRQSHGLNLKINSPLGYGSLGRGDGKKNCDAKKKSTKEGKTHKKGLWRVNIKEKNTAMP